jgi:hypothetical protein
VTLAMSITDEIREVLFAHTDFIFTIQREVIVVDSHRIASASIASTELVNVSSAKQSIAELARLLNSQATLLRKMAKLLRSLIGKSSALGMVEDTLQRVKVIIYCMRGC